MNQTVSLYNNAGDVYGVSHINIGYILNYIKTGHSGLKDIIDNLRSVGKPDDYKRLKSKLLPMFTASGNFRYRSGSVENLSEYSDMLVLDFDWEDPDWDVVQEFKEKLIKYATPLHIYAIWQSPKKGVKAIMLHDNTNPAYHYNLFWQVKKRLFPRTPQLDTNCSDLCRACYLSYDPDLFVNQDLMLKPYHFEFDTTISEPPSSSKSSPSKAGANKRFSHTPEQIEQNRIFQLTMTDKALMNRLIKTFNRSDPEYYKDGHRHKEVIRRAVIYCKDGILYDNAVWSLVGQFGEFTKAGLHKEDIESMVSACYRNATDDFGTERQDFINHITFRK